MKVYDVMDAVINLEGLMDEAWREGSVRIRQRLGRDFLLRPVEFRSPLDAMPGVEELFGDDDYDDDDDDEEYFELDTGGITPLKAGPMTGKAA